MSFKIHEANESEKIAAYTNVHDVWGADLNLQDHLERRLNSTQHKRARWFVLVDDAGTVKSSLGVYPLHLMVLGKRMSGIGIGAVHTPKPYQKQGLAAALLREVLRIFESTDAALLYSDIAPRYYETFGFQRLASFRTMWDLSPVDGLSLPAGWALRPIDPTSDLDLLRRLYDDDIARYEIAVARDPEYWAWSLAKVTDTRFCVLMHHDTPGGYVRFAHRGDKITVEERVGPATAPVDQALAMIAREHGVTKVKSWVMAPEVEPSSGPVVERDDEITMIRFSRPPSAPIDPKMVRFFLADHF